MKYPFILDLYGFCWCFLGRSSLAERAGRDHPEPQQSLAGSELHIPTSGDGTDEPGGTAGHGNPMAWDWAGNMHSSAGVWGFLSPRKVENKVLNKCLLQWKTGIV